jgi:hypothetical protein
LKDISGNIKKFMKGTFLESRIDDKQGGIASKRNNIDSSIGHIYPQFLICCEIRYGTNIESRLTPTNENGSIWQHSFCPNLSCHPMPSLAAKQPCRNFSHVALHYQSGSA